MAQDINNFIDPKLVDTIEKLNKTIIDLGSNIDKMTLPQIKAMEKELAGLSKTTGVNIEAQKKLLEEKQKALKVEEQLINNEKKIEDAQKGITDSLVKQKLELQKATAAQKDKIKAEQGAEGSLLRMRLRLKELTAEYDKAGVRTKAATKEINDLTSKILKAEQATGRHGRNVGNYTSVWDKFKNVTSALPGQLGNIASGAEGVVTKIASLGPVGGVVAGTIAAAGAGLLAFFTATERGAEMMERKWAGMKAAWKTLVGEIAKGGEEVAKTFEEPKKGQFWEKLFYTTGSLLGQNFAKTVGTIGQKMDGASYSAEQYTKVLQDVEDEEKRLLVPRALANKSLIEAYEIYNDLDKSLDDRKKALDEIIIAEDKATAEEMKLQAVKIAGLKEIKLQRDLDGLDATEARNNLYAAEKELIELESSSSARKRKTVKMKISLDKEEIASQKEKNKNYKEQLEIEDKKNEEMIKLENDLIKNAEQKEIKLHNDRIKRSEERLAQEQRINELIYKSSFERDEESEKKESEKLDNLLKETDEKIKDNNNISKEDFDKKQEAEKQLKEQAVQNAGELGNILFDMKLSQLDREFKAAEGNAKRQAEISKKIAKAEKEKALFNIAIKTGEAVMASLARIPLPIGLPFMLMNLAMGAAQAGAIIAKPIPQFAKGTNFAPGGAAIVGEKGRELIQRPNGQIFLANNPALVNLERGSKVINNSKTEAYLNDGNIVSELRQTRKAIQRMPQPVFMNGSKIAERSGNYWKNYRNEKHRLN